MLIAQRRQKIAVAVNVRMEPLELTDQRPLGFLILWIEGANLRMQQIAEEQRSLASTFLRRSACRIKSPPPLGLIAGHEGPTDLLCVG